jgi:hypothetical protein
MMLQAWLIAAVSFCIFGQVEAATVFWGSDPVAPGETALLVGEDFGTNPVVKAHRLADKGGSGGGITAAMQISLSAASSQSIKFGIPQRWRNGIFEVEVQGAGKSATVLLNAPAIYWIQGDMGMQASPGGWLRVFGRNIQARSQTTAVSLHNSIDGSSYLLKAQSGSVWDARFVVPDDMPQGTYDVRVHNGWGADRGWVRAGQLHVAAAEPWPTARFNVKDFGARGDGVADDSKALEAALDKAGRNGGGIVYLPRGRYVVKQMLSLPRFVELDGEGENLAAIMFADFDVPPPALIRGTNHFRLRGLAIYASNHKFVIEGDTTQTRDGMPGHVSIQRVRVRAVKYRGRITADELDRKHRDSFKSNFETEDAVHLGGSDIRITDSDFYSSARSLALSGPIGAYVVNNRFSNGRAGWYSISGADGVIFENNTIVGADLMATGGGVNNLGDYAYSQNVWFGHNHLETMNGFDREAMTSDAPGGLYYGNVAAASATTLTLASPLDDAALKSRSNWRGAGVMVLGGRGAGQVARVKSVAAQTIELEKPMEITPDNTSVITVTMMQQNYLFIDNTFVDAGLAIQYYGTSINHVAAGNKSTRTGGMSASGRWYHHYQPSWYCQFLDNELSDGNTYRGGSNAEIFSGEAVLAVYGLQKSPNRAPLAMGEVLRRNRLLGNAHIEVLGGGDSAAPGVRDVIVENNVVIQSDVPFKQDRGVIGLYLSGNHFLNATPIVSSSQPK